RVPSSALASPTTGAAYVKRLPGRPEAVGDVTVTSAIWKIPEKLKFYCLGPCQYMAGDSKRIVHCLGSVALTAEQPLRDQHIQRTRDLGARVCMRHRRRAHCLIDKLRVVGSMANERDRQKYH